MSAVDVLAVLREMHIRASESVDFSANDARESSAAIAAVAELIEMAEMANECLNRHGIHLAEGGSGRTLGAALARVGGA